MLIRKPSIRLMPAVCDVSVTDACNAACDFCGFARQKRAGQKRHWIDRNALARGLPLLRRRGVKYLGIQGGEPLLHPEIDRIITDAVEVGMRVALVTNGWALPAKIDVLAAAGLRTLTVSLDSANLVTHEQNRGLSGLTARIQQGLKRASRYQIFRVASITVSRPKDEVPTARNTSLTRSSAGMALEPLARAVTSCPRSNNRAVR